MTTVTFVIGELTVTCPVDGWIVGSEHDREHSCQHACIVNLTTEQATDLVRSVWREIKPVTSGA